MTSSPPYADPAHSTNHDVQASWSVGPGSLPQSTQWQRSPALPAPRNHTDGSLPAHATPLPRFELSPPEVTQTLGGMGSACGLDRRVGSTLATLVRVVVFVMPLRFELFSLVDELPGSFGNDPGIVYVV